MPLAGPMATEDEERCAQNAEGGPQVIERQFFFEVEVRKRNKHRQRDDFLQDFELSDGHYGCAGAVGGDLQEVFEQSDSPTDERGDEPRFA